MPSTPQAKAAIKKLLPNEVNGTVYELGCGWGGLLRLLSKKYPHVIGYEISFFPWLVSRLFTKQVYRKDFMTADLSDAGLIVCYLYPKKMTELYEKIKLEAKPGTYILSNTFSIRELEPLRKEKLDDLYKTPVYLYRL